MAKKPKTKISCLLEGGRWINGKCDLPEKEDCGCGVKKKK